MGTIGLALSGGGHRATAWSLGALLASADMGANSDTVAVSSVSGGSIANGVVARETDLRTADGEELRRAVRPLVRHIADVGLFFFGPATNPYVLSTLGLAGVTAVGAAGTLAAGLAGGGWRVAAPAAATAGVAVGTFRRFSRRSEVTEQALDATHFHGTTLAALADRGPVHIFCATELQSGNHVYFSPGFVYGYRFGVGQPSDMALATAVQASACLPGAFVPRRLPTARHGFVRSPAVDEPEGIPEHMVLNDGGVYDNMGDEWFRGYGQRRHAWPGLPDVCPDIDELVVVNASGGWGWQEIDRWSRLRAERVGVLGSKDVLYNSSTRIRRRELVALFRGGEARGALVHIPQTPYDAADAFLRSSDPAEQARAQAVLDLLGDDEASRQRWEETAKRSTAVPTVLRKLGREVTLDLLGHAYTLTACNLHVILGRPLPADIHPRADLQALVDP